MIAAGSMLRVAAAAAPELSRLNTSAASALPL
jgi:hypothetical protein